MQKCSANLGQENACIFDVNLTLSRAGFFGAPVGQGGGGGGHKVPTLVKTLFPFSESTQVKIFKTLVRNWVLWRKLGFHGNYGYGFKGGS